MDESKTQCQHLLFVPHWLYVLVTQNRCHVKLKFLPQSYKKKHKKHTKCVKSWEQEGKNIMEMPVIILNSFQKKSLFSPQ